MVVYIRPIQDQDSQCSSMEGRGKRAPVRNRGAVGSWWLLREGDSDIFKGVAPCGLILLHLLVPYPEVYGQPKLHSVGLSDR